MKKEDLMKPRFKVVADYPLSTIPVGEIVGAATPDIEKYFEKYPHLFKALEWWEEREIDDMPKYLKYKSFVSDFNGTWVVYPVKFDKSGEGWDCTVENRVIINGNYLKDKLPSNEEEYKQFMTTVKK